MKIILNIILIHILMSGFAFAEVTDSSQTESKFEVFPLIAYDTDIGLGLGAKAFYLNPFDHKESLDLIVFGSTKGETWIKFAFSIPDFELRQGTKYDWAFDLIVDYDKWINASYFGIGNTSRFKDRIYYTKEPFDISLNLSRGFNEIFVGSAGLRYRSVSIYFIESIENPGNDYIELQPGKLDLFSYFLKFNYDTRNSFINPSEGFFLEAGFENTLISPGSNAFIKYFFGSRYFYKVSFLNSVLAARFRTETLNKKGLPVHVLLPAGGNRTLRGFVQDRFLDAATAIFNFEFRFPILGRLGVIAGFDMGRVWPSLDKFGFSNWASNYVIGLRYYMDTFVVRGDIGFSRESTNLYLNIGHMF